MDNKTAEKIVNRLLNNVNNDIKKKGNPYEKMRGKDNAKK